MYMYIKEKVAREKKICLTQIVQQPCCITVQPCDCILIEKIVKYVQSHREQGDDSKHGSSENQFKVYNSNARDHAVPSFDTIE